MPIYIFYLFVSYSFYYNYLEKRYNIVRDADGFVLGLSYPDAKIVKVQDSPLCPDFISAIDENHIYNPYGKYCFTLSMRQAILINWTSIFKLSQNRIYTQ